MRPQPPRSWSLVSTPALACGLIASILILAGCGAPPPTPDEAARAILASEPFRAARVETIDSESPGRCQEALSAQAGWRRWTSLGIGRLSEVVTAAGPVCRLAVEETFRREAENWSHRSLPASLESGAAIVLPVAVPSLVRISEIRSTARGVAEASFEWQWRLNQAGQRLGIDTRVSRGWAQLVLDDSGWRAARVEMSKE
ncbi:MAG: hypothetical protein ACOYX1_04990 [Acidobacteriota bacterium]